MRIYGAEGRIQCRGSSVQSNYSSKAWFLEIDAAS